MPQHQGRRDGLRLHPSSLVPFALNSSILLDASSLGAPPFPFLFPCLSYYGVLSTPGTSYLPDNLVLTVFSFPLCRFLPQPPPSAAFFSIGSGLEQDRLGSAIACLPPHYRICCAHPIFCTRSVAPLGFEIGFLQWYF
jgi:hypothetical protein